MTARRQVAAAPPCTTSVHDVDAAPLGVLALARAARFKDCTNLRWIQRAIEDVDLVQQAIQGLVARAEEQTISRIHCPCYRVVAHLNAIQIQAHDAAVIRPRDMMKYALSQNIIDADVL